MLTTNSDFQSTAYFTSDGRTPWIDVDHPDFYYDPGFKPFCHDRLSELALLKPNWDRDGAPAINPTILGAVHQFVDALPDHVAVRPMVVPLTSGNVQLEWHNGRRALELEFELPDSIHYLKWDPANGIEDEAVISPANQDQAIELIRWFMKGFFNG